MNSLLSPNPLPPCGLNLLKKGPLYRFAATKSCQNHAFFDILANFSQIIKVFTPKCYTSLERYGHED